MPYLIVLSLNEALAFGYGIAFLIYGWPRIRVAIGDSTKVSR